MEILTESILSGKKPITKRISEQAPADPLSSGANPGLNKYKVIIVNHIYPKESAAFDGESVSLIDFFLSEEDLRNEVTNMFAEEEIRVLQKQSDQDFIAAVNKGWDLFDNEEVTFVITKNGEYLMGEQAENSFYD